MWNAARAKAAASAGSRRRAVQTQANAAADWRNMECTGKVLRKYYDAHRLPAGKTAAREFERGVLPVRQLNNPEVDDYKCPRH